MPYDVQQGPGFLGSLVGIAGAGMRGYQEAMQMKEQEAEAKQQAESTALQQQLTAQQIQKGARDAIQEQQVQRFRSNLQVPKNFATMKPQDQANYFLHRAASAQALGDDQTAATAIAMANSIGTGQYKEAGASELMSRADLDKAKAQRTQQLHNEFEQSVNAKIAIAEKTEAGRIQVANIRAASARATAGAGADRGLLQLIMQQKMLDGLDARSAYTQAMATYRTQMSAVEKANAQHAALNEPLEALPDKPQPQDFNINISGGGGVGGTSLGDLVQLYRAIHGGNLDSLTGGGGGDKSGLPALGGNKPQPIQRGVPLGKATFVKMGASGRPIFLNEAKTQYIYSDGTPVPGQ